MKRGAWKHPKMTALSIELGVPRIWAVGVVESLIHWAAEYCPTGAVGRYDNRTIAREVGYDGDGDKLVAALVAAGWLNECADKRIRLFIHDWSAHCEDAVHARVWKDGDRFADGGEIRKRCIPSDFRDKPQPKKQRKKRGDSHGTPGDYHVSKGGALAFAPALALADSKDIPPPSDGDCDRWPESRLKAAAEAMYQDYPLKDGHLKAVKAAVKAIKLVAREKHVSHETAAGQIHAAVRAYAASPLIATIDRQFIPMPATWLNRGSYTTDPSEWRARTNGHVTEPPPSPPPTPADIERMLNLGAKP